MITEFSTLDADLIPRTVRNFCKNSANEKQEGFKAGDESCHSTDISTIDLEI